MPSSSDFNAICYLNRYPDLKTMYQDKDGSWKYGKPSNRPIKNLTEGTNAFWHWQNFGMAEGRVSGCDLPGTVYSNEFNAAAYLARYPDVKGYGLTGQVSQWATNPEGHYQTIGIVQNRMPGYEILTPGQPVTGMVSPGTTTTIPDDPTQNLTPGDGTILPALNPTDPSGGTNLLPAAVLPDATPTGTAIVPAPATGVMAWIEANPMEAAAIGIGLFLILTKKKKNRA